MFKKKVKNNCEYKIYSNIKLLPLINYILFLDNNDYRFLLILKDYNELPEISEKCKKELVKAFENILFQLPSDAIDNTFLLLLLEIEKIKTNILLSKDATERKVLNDVLNIKIKELLDIDVKKTALKNYDINKEIVNIETILSININRQAISLYDFFMYRKQAHEKIRALESQKNNNKIL